MSYEHNLKPCPWCGGEADAPDGPYGRPVWVYEARCTVCHALGAQADTKTDVVDAWNTRPGEDALRARAEAAEQRAEATEAALAQARADARVLACQWRAVDDTEDLQFFGACWREAHPGRSEGDLGRDPTMADLVAALRRALGSAR